MLNNLKHVNNLHNLNTLNNLNSLDNLNNINNSNNLHNLNPKGERGGILSSRFHPKAKSQGLVPKILGSSFPPKSQIASPGP